MNKQRYGYITNPPQTVNTLSLLHTSGNESQYLIYSLFRILRPLRKRSKLTINELIILNAIVLYNKYVGTSFSYSAIMRYVGYFNDNKMRYYFKSLEAKGCIVISDIVNNSKRYKITSKTIDILDDLEESYNNVLKKFCIDNNIIL